MDSTEAKVVLVRVRSARGKESPGQVRIQNWDKKARTKRALKTLGLCWGGAVISAPVPIAHFVLVPGLLLAGPIAAHWVWNQESVVVGGESRCPDCGAELPLVRNADRWPLEDSCGKCRSALKIEKTN